jgi:hypothetical protein
MRARWNSAHDTIADFGSNPSEYSCAEYAANYTDWRLPNVKELESLVNYGVAIPGSWLNSEGFVNVNFSYYWSSTTYQGNAKQAWMLSMKNGTDAMRGKSKMLYLLPVRGAFSGSTQKLLATGQTASFTPGDDGSVQTGAEWPVPRFTDNGDGTMTDNLTGLMWLKDGGCIKGKWNHVLGADADFDIDPSEYSCEKYAANYTDWRLPNVKELESLVNYGVATPESWLNSEGFVNVNFSYYWSSTTYQGNAKQAWMLDMRKARRMLKGKGYTSFALPVRGGIQ